MIYDVMTAYRQWLLMSYRLATADTYYKRLCTLLEGQSITDTVNRFDINKVLDKLKQIKYKNHFSQSKNALLHFCEYKNILLTTDTLDKISELERRTKKKYRKLEVVEFNKLDRKIKHIKNQKLKLSYQVIMATGLRVLELSSISSNDCDISDNQITFKFTGKGGEKETVIIEKSEYSTLYGRIKEHIKNTPKDKKVFYSAVYLQRKAKELDFQCHDLRRIYAKLEYKKCRSKTEVMKKMRHSNIKNTNIYLKSKVIF